MGKESINWIVTHDGIQNPFGHQCLRCGAYHKLPDRLPIDEFIKIGKAFINLHKLCKPNQGASMGKPRGANMISGSPRKEA